MFAGDREERHLKLLDWQHKRPGRLGEEEKSSMTLFWLLLNY